MHHLLTLSTPFTPNTYKEPAAMEQVNSKLYIENCYIMEQNERLRKTAELLSKENQALLNEFQKRLAATSSPSATSEDFGRENDQPTTTLSSASKQTNKASKSGKNKSKKL